MASADSTGHVHIWDISVQPRRAQNQRPSLTFPASSPLEAQLDSGRIVKLLSSGPLLLVATELGGVRAFDARTGTRPVWALVAPMTHGVCTSLTEVHDAPGLCTGTSRGMMHLWDLRFQVRLELLAVTAAVRTHVRGSSCMLRA